MKLRFLAFAGEPAARECLTSRTGLVGRSGLIRRVHNDQIEIWASADTPVLANAATNAWLIGFAIDRAIGRPLLAAPTSAQSPAAILAGCWGGYVVLARRPRGHFALREPSGSVLVYHRRDGDCDIYASDDAMLHSGSPSAPAPDMDYIRNWLSFPFLRTARTGCIGASEILPGQCRQVEGGCAKVDQVWSPAAFAAQSPIVDFEDAARQLRREMLRSIPRMVPAESGVVVKLSGGLDSALVASALAAAGRSFTAVNFATRHPDGDERSYARAAAARCGVKLFELEEQSSAIDLDLAPRSRLRPSRQPLLQGLDHAYAVQWSAIGASTIVDGVGGDNVFAYLNTASPALDAWRCDGAAAAWGAISDLAALHGTTFWSAAGFAWRKARRGTTTRWPANHDFLASAGIVAEPEPHPWLEDLANVRPGTREHVRMILGAHHFVPEPVSGQPALLHPLLAQPILELCLRIPTHLWIDRGRDRAVARAAFATLLPEVILRRRSKGALGGMFRAQFRALAPQLAGFLAEGALAQAGIIERDAVADYLADPDRWAGYRSMRLLEIAAAEQWLRSFG